MKMMVLISIYWNSLLLWVLCVLCVDGVVIGWVMVFMGMVGLGRGGVVWCRISGVCVGWVLLSLLFQVGCLVGFDLFDQFGWQWYVVQFVGLGLVVFEGLFEEGQGVLVVFGIFWLFLYQYEVGGGDWLCLFVWSIGDDQVEVFGVGLVGVGGCRGEGFCVWFDLVVGGVLYGGVWYVVLQGIGQFDVVD